MRTSYTHQKYKYSVRTLAPTGYVAHNSDVYFEDYLYDLSVDPIEKNNLIKSPEYASVRAELKDMLINEMVKVGERKPKILPALFVRKK